MLPPCIDMLTKNDRMASTFCKGIYRPIRHSKNCVIKSLISSIFFWLVDTISPSEHCRFAALITHMRAYNGIINALLRMRSAFARVTVTRTVEPNTDSLVNCRFLALPCLSVRMCLKISLLCVQITWQSQQLQCKLSSSIANPSFGKSTISR